MEKRIKSYIKKGNQNKLKEQETQSLLKVNQNTKIKKEKCKNGDIKIEKKEENILPQRNMKSNKSMRGLFSDSETLKTETTRGETMAENNKNRYIYKKSFNRKNFSFAIRNYFSNNTKPLKKYEKKHKLNYSLSTNKFFKDQNKTILNTNNNFYRKQTNVLETFRTNYNDDTYKLHKNEASNVILDRSYSNNKINHIYKKKEEFINIEDLLILEEKINDVLLSIKPKSNTPNECFELINSFQQSSLYNNFENYFRDISSKMIVHSTIIYLIYDVIICYHFSFNEQFFNSCYKYLEILLKINHKCYLLLCDLILLKVVNDSKQNIWVDKLRDMVKKNLVHVELNNKEYIAFMLQYDNINYKNPSTSNLMEIKFYNSKIEKYLQCFLNSLNREDEMKQEFCSLFEDICNISADKLLHFFKSKIIQIINENASVAGIESSSYQIFIDENAIQVPYLKNKCPKKFSLVLDLDETLISFKLEPNEENKGIIRFRPYLDSFLSKVKEKYEIIVFTSGTQDYADPLEDAIEQNQKYFDVRLYRQHTIAFGNDIVKDISRIGRPLDKILIVENMPQNFRLQKENGILIKSFYGEDIYDNALDSLGNILIKIANEFNDVRKGIAKYKNEILNKVSTNLSKTK